MVLTNRITRIDFIRGMGLLAADTAGRVHLLNENLEPQLSSPAVRGGQLISNLVVTARWIVGKDRRGNLMKWTRDTLDLAEFLEAPTMSQASGTPSGPVPESALAELEGRIYTTNSQGDLVVLDADSFSVESITPQTPGTDSFEFICAEHPTVQAMADRSGRILVGSLRSAEFRTATTAPERVHEVRYDTCHNRFWVVESGAKDRPGLRNGVIIVGRDGTVEAKFPFSRYELTFLEFSPDQSVAYTGGMEGILYVIANDTRPMLVKSIGGFPHELADLAVGPDGSLFVLTLSNELVKVDQDFDCVQVRAPVLRQDVLGLAPALEDPHRLYCGTDDGVTVLEVRDGPAGGGPAMVPAAHHDTRFGMIRQLAALPGGYAAIGHREVVFRADGNGKVRWQAPLDDMGFGLAVSPGYQRVLVATGVCAVELDAETGETRGRLTVDGVPLTAAAYGPAGERVLADRHGVICAFAQDTDDELWWTDTGQVPGRVWSQDDAVYVCSDAGLLQLVPGEGVVSRRWGGATCECALVDSAEGLVHVAFRDGELHTYDYATGERVCVVRDLPDVPGTVALSRSAEGRSCLIVGGRGGYLSAFSVSLGGTLTRLRNSCLPRRQGPSFRLTAH